MKNPILFVLLIIFTILNIIDSITALFILPGESNIIYLLTGNIYIVILLKLLIIGILWFYYRRNIFPSHTWYYNTILFILFADLILLMAVYGNIEGIKIMSEHPEIIETLNAMPQDEKTVLFGKEYFKFVSLFYFLPVTFSILSFSLYRWSLNKVIIDKKFYKKLKWWHP